MKTGNGAVRGIGRNDDLRVSGRYERKAEVRSLAAVSCSNSQSLV